MSISATTQLHSADEFAQLVIASHNGTPVRLADVANVYAGQQDAYQAAWFHGKPAVLMYVYKKADANVIATVDLVKDQLPALRAYLPPGTTLTPFFDGTPTIRASLHEVQATLLISLAMVILTMALFLRRLAPTLIAAVAVPLSLAGAFVVMYILGYTLEQPHPAGAGDRDRLRGRRCDRGDREHHPPHRRRHVAHAGHPHRRARDRLHHRLDHRLADRRVHPAAVRRRRHRHVHARIRGDPGGGDHGLRAGFADADAGVVRAFPQWACRQGKGTAVAARARAGRFPRRHAARLHPRAEFLAAPRAAVLADPAGADRGHVLPVRRGQEPACSRRRTPA